MVGQNPNLELLALAVTHLGPLADEMVFVGGCAAGLLITDPAAPPVRVTRDVDAIVQVVSLQDYYQLSARLRAQGLPKIGTQKRPSAGGDPGPSFLTCCRSNPVRWVLAANGTSRPWKTPWRIACRRTIMCVWCRGHTF